MTKAKEGALSALFPPCGQEPLSPSQLSLTTAAALAHPVPTPLLFPLPQTRVSVCSSYYLLHFRVAILVSILMALGALIPSPGSSLVIRNPISTFTSVANPGRLSGMKKKTSVLTSRPTDKNRHVPGIHLAVEMHFRIGTFVCFVIGIFSTRQIRSLSN